MSQENKPRIQLQLGKQTPSNVMQEIREINSNYILEEYGGPDGNKPAEYSNYLFVWNGSQVPWNETPLIELGAEKDGMPISQEGFKFTNQQYIIGYSVGPNVNSPNEKNSDGASPYRNVCATAVLPANWKLEDIIIDPSNLSVSTISTRVVTFTFKFPNGFNPGANKSWIGLFNGHVIPYDLDPFAFVPITTTTSLGSVAIGQLAISPGETYTAALYTCGYDKDFAKRRESKRRIAATLVFDTGFPLSRDAHK
ncbi:hypothetical protein [Mycetohabitans sp. B6]|uniref:hypothetical protein n=1 Tax=Mycetohabitans sp. B6 TaxID=2841843 RepID=UPI001F3BA328|nr:hypothetical protein [Mycetohabitans sp. B6]MCG1048663.1 hypothetical protein [Mycetohabitans sp. B6]